MFRKGNRSKMTFVLTLAIALSMLLSGLAISMGGVKASNTPEGTNAPGIANPPGPPLNLVADQGPGFVWL
jgi:hypothetical protein